MAPYNTAPRPWGSVGPRIGRLLDERRRPLLLLVDDVDPAALRETAPNRLIPPLHGALLKNEQDVHLFERLAFLGRREGVRPGA